MSARVHDINLASWFPALRADPRIPLPWTLIVETDVNLLGLLDGDQPKGFSAFVDELCRAGDAMRWPCFLRTGHTAGKHDYRYTCHVPGPDDMGSHVAALVEASMLADLMGLPTDTWVVRELLDVGASFTAFDGLPIGREFRFFTDEAGRVSGWHPYWPPDAVAQGRPSLEEPGPLGWRARLVNAGVPRRGEIEYLTAQTERVAALVPGAWSVDWLFVPSRQEWVLTDMAWAERSFCWTDYPEAPEVVPA